MRIGCLVEGPITDLPFLEGVREQLCPQAELLEPHCRGRSKRRRRAELAVACAELDLRGADVIVNLNDANEMSWSERRKHELSKIPDRYHHKLLLGAPEPNIEMWLIADAAYFEKRTSCPCGRRPRDPKPMVQKALADAGLSVTDFVAGADLRAWEREDNSFRGFMRECRDMASQLGCQLAGP